MNKTHDVINQAPPLFNYNLFTADLPLQEALRQSGAGWAEEKLRELGQIIGSEEMIRAGFLANEYKPVLRTHSRFGDRIDEVDFHPAWHQLMSNAVAHGIHSAPWVEGKAGSHVARAAAAYLECQNEQGHMCPIAMTYGALPVIRQQPNIIADWEEKILSYKYDPRFIPAPEKTNAIIGMGMTEKQGGSDVRSNTTKAVAIGKGGPGEEYLLTGHKWFCSAPMCDAFLILAQTAKGPSCFFMPRWTPEGKRNRIFIQRLKDKLGDRSNASSELEFDQTWARLIGEEGRGVVTIIEMANYTRLDCAIAGAALMRQGLTQAIHHATHRMAFGKLLIDQPLMQNVLADICIESEAATLSCLRLAKAYDQQKQSETEKAFSRIATAILKFWLTKRSILAVSEALEVHGGNAFVEESIMPRIYRQAPLNSLWEGSGNVMCLDVLRALAKEPLAGEVVMQEIRKGCSNPHLKDYAAQLESQLKEGAPDEVTARLLVERFALAIQASILVTQGDPMIAEVFCRTRLSAERQLGFGALAKDIPFKPIIERSRPR